MRCFVNLLEFVFMLNKNKIKINNMSFTIISAIIIIILSEIKF